MDISLEWTHEERLRILGILTAAIKRAVQSPRTADTDRVVALADMAFTIAWEPSDVLEQMRGRIICELGHIP